MNWILSCDHEAMPTESDRERIADALAAGELPSMPTRPRDVVALGATSDVESYS